MGKYDLDNQAYDSWLAQNGKERELRKRKVEKRSANDGIRGWHFGIADRPVHAKDRESYRYELKKRGLMLRDDVKKELR